MKKSPSIHQILNSNLDKPDTKISIDTALTHMVMEDMIHSRELSAVLWQMNLEAPYFGFWRYKHMHQ